MAAPRSTRRTRFDDDGWEPSDRYTIDDNRDTQDAADPVVDEPAHFDDADLIEPAWSTYVDATRGPAPVPEWVITDARAIDTDHGVLKTGKEADVSLIERVGPDGRRSLLAAKRYRSSQHRMFHRDAGYLEGRSVRRSREMRAMATRTAFGRDLLAGQWAHAEFAVLSQLWSVGAAVPYPVQLIGTELIMEFVGSTDGQAAPRLAQIRPDQWFAAHLYDEMVRVLGTFADAGLAHGDLSPYNVLVDGERLVLIDLPQAVDLVGNPRGFEYLHRDCVNITGWFARHGVVDATADDLYYQLIRSIPGVG